METPQEKITRLENRISELHSKNAALRFENEQLQNEQALWEKEYVHARHLSLVAQIDAARKREQAITSLKLD